MTSVDRDDLEDGGASHFAEVIAATRRLSPGTTIEVLTPDFLRKDGAIEAVADRFPDSSVLQIDAHGDTRESYHGSTHNHACVMARARERCPIVQVGIRSVDTPEVAGLDPERVFYAHRIAAEPDEGWMDRVVDLLTPHVYVTIDVDAFDPAIVPATGTPEPGGLDWYQITGLLARVARSRRVVGFDVVELLPGHHASAFTAAKLIYRFLAEIFQSGRGGTSID